MNTRFLTVLTMLAFLGFSVSAVAAKSVCQQDDTRPKCNRDNGGGGEDHGDPPAQYEAELIDGGFYFDPKIVTRNNRGNGYNSTEDLQMARDSDFPNENPDENPLPTDTDAWNEVFASCSTFDDVTKITGIDVSDNWSINNSGGNQAGTEGSRISIAFRDAVADGYPEVDVDLYLRGTLPADFPEDPEDLKESIVIYLTHFTLYGGATGNEGCVSSGDLVSDSVLKMTRTQ